MSLKILFCMYKMVDISAETSNKAEVSVIRVQENDDVKHVYYYFVFLT